MATRVSELIDAYEAALRAYEVGEPQTRDWGGTHDPAGAAALTRRLAEAEEALVDALERSGPVVYRGQEYRVSVPPAPQGGCAVGPRLQIGPAARDAGEVEVS